MTWCRSKKSWHPSLILNRTRAFPAPVFHNIQLKSLLKVPHCSVYLPSPGPLTTFSFINHLHANFRPSIYFLVCVCVCVCVLVTQSCPILCDPMDGRLPGSSVHGILQARILERVAISFSRLYPGNLIKIIGVHYWHRKVSFHPWVGKIFLKKNGNPF